MAASSLETAGDYPVATILELGQWVNEVFDPAYAAHLAELERNPLADPEAQAARLACDRPVFRWKTMAQLPLQERGAIFRAAMQP